MIFMDYNTSMRYVSERAVDVGVKMGAGAGLLAGVAMAMSNEGLRAEGDISIGYAMIGLGVIYSIIGGVLGAAAGVGLENLIKDYVKD